MSRKAATTVATKATKAPKRSPKTIVAPAPKARTRKAEPQPEPVADRGAAISEGMKELADARSAARQRRNGAPAKGLVFSEFYKAILAGKAVDIAAIARKFQDVKETSIRSWVSYWTNRAGAADDKGFPSNARSKDIQSKLKTALKKAAVA